MNKGTKGILIAIVTLLVIGGVCAWLLRPKPIHLKTAGQLQDGADYRVVCALVPASGTPWDRSELKISSLELFLSGRARSVPSAAFKDIGRIDPKRPLQVTEEGPVIVVSTWTNDQAGSHPVQWRFLNGQFAQRRLLNVATVDVRNFQSSIDRPSIIGPAPEGAPRKLHAPSLLSSPDSEQSEARREH